MSSNDTYLETARAYADGVRVLFAPSGVPTGERGERGPASYEDLVGRAEQLAPQSAQLTEVAATQLDEEDPTLRVQASTRLLAKALTDLDVSLYLFQAAMDEEDEIAWTEEAEGERSRSGFSLEGQLAFLLGEVETGLGAAERGAIAPADVPSARSELSGVIEDTLALISEQAGKTTQTAFTGLLGIGIAQVAEAAGLVGLEIAKVLGQAEAVTRLYELVRDFALQAYNSLLTLLGPRLAEFVGQQVLDWLKSFEEGEKIGQILEKLYETERTGRDLGVLVGDSQAELERFAAAIADVDSLEAAYRQQIQLADQVLPKLKYLRLIPVTALPAGRLLLAAVYIALGGYVVLAGADYVDAQRLRKLDRVPGVRRVVEAHLVGVQGRLHGCKAGGIAGGSITAEVRFDTVEGGGAAVGAILGGKDSHVHVGGQQQHGDTHEINTGGGAFFSGKVDARGGDFVGRDEAKGFTCPSCHKAVEAEWKACPYCGDELSAGPRFCTNCSVELLPGAQFCQQCGAKVGQQALLEEAIRLDVHTPETVEVEIPFDIGVAIRQPESPIPEEPGLPSTVSKPGRVFRPASSEPVKYRVQVSAPDCEVHTDDEYTFLLRPGVDSEVHYFQLTVKRDGHFSILIQAYQEDGLLAADTRVHLVATLRAVSRPVLSPTPEEAAKINHGAFLIYRNLDLEAFDYQADQDEERFRVRVAHSPAGEQKLRDAEEVTLEPRLRRRLRRLEIRAAGLAEMIKLGQELADLLFPPRARAFLDTSLKLLEGNQGLRVRLKLDTYALADLPWEYVYIAHPDTPADHRGPEGFLVLDHRISIVRHEVMGQPLVSLDPVDAGDLHLVALLANPHGDLDLEIEQRNVEEILSEVPELEPRIHSDATVDTLLDSLTRGVHIFHFAGHGRFEGGMGETFGTKEGLGFIELEGDDPEQRKFPAGKLAQNLRGRGVRLAMLTACEVGRADPKNAWSGVAPALTQAGIPAVLGMQYKVRDTNAIAFSRQFYRALAAGESIDAAVSDGRLAIFNRSRDDERDWGVPVLYLRTDEGVLFPKVSQGPMTSRLEEESAQAILTVVSACYRRAIFTRTHAQLSRKAMFKSIKSAIALVQPEIPKIALPELQQKAADIVTELTEIQSYSKRKEDLTPTDFSEIDVHKLRVINSLSELSTAVRRPFSIPANRLTEEVFFTEEDADLEPSF